MGGGISRRGFLIGVGTAAAGAALFVAARGSTPRPPATSVLGLPTTSGEGPTLADECCARAEHDGWLVTTADKRRLSLAVVDYNAGWYSQERNEETSWRWSRQAATVTISNPSVDAVLYLDHDARAGLFSDGPRMVTVSVGDRAIESFVADTPGRSRHGIPLPAGVLGDMDRAEIRIAVDRPFVPADLVAGARDIRELGIMVFDVSLEVGPRSPPRRHRHQTARPAIGPRSR